MSLKDLEAEIKKLDLKDRALLDAVTMRIRNFLEAGLIEGRSRVTQRIIHPQRHFAIDVALRVLQNDQRRIILRRVGACVLFAIEILERDRIRVIDTFESQR